MAVLVVAGNTVGWSVVAASVGEMVGSGQFDAGPGRVWCRWSLGGSINCSERTNVHPRIIPSLAWVHREIDGSIRPISPIRINDMKYCIIPNTEKLVGNEGAKE